MSKFSTRFAPALALAIVAVATGAKADYSYTLTSGTTPTFSTPLPFTATISPTTTMVGDSATSTATVLNFTYSGFPTAPTMGTTTFSFSETFTGTPGTEVVNFTGTFQYFTSAASVSVGYAATATVVSGSGYNVPSLLVNYFNTSGTTGQVQLTVIPTAVAVPEPASMVMLGLGLIVPAGFAARRRLVARA